jgi:uncharacterized membrane protein
LAGIESREFRFQCPNCGHDLRQTIGRLKANERMICAGCNVGINIDTGGSTGGPIEITRSMDEAMPQIVVKFFR